MLFQINLGKVNFNEFEARGKTEMKEKENIQETIQHLGELCYDNGITENDIWNFIRDKKSTEDFLWTK